MLLLVRMEKALLVAMAPEETPMAAGSTSREIFSLYPLLLKRTLLWGETDMVETLQEDLGAMEAMAAPDQMAIGVQHFGGRLTENREDLAHLEGREETEQEELAQEEMHMAVASTVRAMLL
jgi:hypothetical protein